MQWTIESALTYHRGARYVLCALVYGEFFQVNCSRRQYRERERKREREAGSRRRGSNNKINVSICEIFTSGFTWRGQRAIDTGEIRCRLRKTISPKTQVCTLRRTRESFHLLCASHCLVFFFQRGRRSARGHRQIESTEMSDRSLSTHTHIYIYLRCLSHMRWARCTQWNAVSWNQH